MKRLQKHRLLMMVLAFSSSLGVLSAEEPLPSENGRELLVLRNGQILEGRITKLKDHYLVDLLNGEIRIPAAEADFVCRNLEEGYERKRAVIQAGNWQDHLELAHWCMKHQLRDHAAAELAAGEAVSPNNPMFSALRRQMEPIPEPAAKSEKAPPPEGTVSNEELDRLVRGLPPKAMETFTQTVQPVLINNCTAAGCHGPQSTTNLRLSRVTTGEAANRRLTQRNLYAVMQYVNSENPAQSPLLTLPAAPHGSAKDAIYTERRAGQYLRIAEWVMGLGPSDQPAPTEILANRELPKNPADEPPADVSMPPRLLSRDAQKAKPLAATKKYRGQPIPEAAAASNEVTPASYQEPPAEFLQSNHLRSAAASLPDKAISPVEPSSRVPPMQKVKRGAPLPQAASKDPFDPEIFNRRYHKDDAPQEGVKHPADAVCPEKTPDKG